ncbi:MAG: hypothetical protein AAGA75_07350, partial [Cyanobacteria bacterium P01_E01_bin.6]
VWQVAVSPTGDRIATSGDDGTARLWDLQGNQLTAFEGHRGIVWQVAVSPTGDRIATSGDDGTTRLWDLRGQQIAQYEGRLGAFNRDWSRVLIIQPGNHLIRDAEGEVVTLWRVDPLETLITRACDRLRPFLRQSDQVTDEDRDICRVEGRE